MSITNLSEFKKRQHASMDKEITNGQPQGYLDYLDNQPAYTDDYEMIYERYVKYLLHESELDRLCLAYNNNVRRYNRSLIYEHKEKRVMKAINQFIRVIEKNENAKETLGNLYSDKSLCDLRSGDRKKAYNNEIYAYDLYKEALGENDIATIRSKIQISNLLFMMEKTKEAEEGMIKILEENSVFFKGDSPEILEILELMISTYYFMMGETEGKVRLCKLLYERSCEIHGENHPDSFEALSNMAMTHRDKDPDKYLDVVKSAYEKAIIQLGSNHPTTWRIVTDLSYAYKKVYRFNEAFDLLTKLYEMKEVEHGKESKMDFKILLEITEVITDVKSLQENYDVEQDYYESIRDEYSEEEIATTIDIINKMREALKDYDKTLENAEKKKDQVLGILQEIKPEDRTTCFWMAKVYEELDKYVDAIELMERYHLSIVQEFGENHVDSIFSLGEVAHYYQMAGRYDDAIDTYDKAWKLSEDTFGVDDSMTKMMYNSCYFAKGMQNTFEIKNGK